MAYLEADNLCKQYRHTAALAGVSLRVEQGEMLAIVGRSGSGKSTLMNLLGCLDTPSAGDYRLGGRSVATLSRRELAVLRNREIGFVFQQFHLIGTLSARENVELPLLYRGLNRAERRRRAEECLRDMGLADRMDHRPAELSGGQQQRVAIARAIAGRPPILLADEPTGNLDSQSVTEVMDCLKALHRQGHTVLIITHDEAIAADAPRRVRLEAGRIQPESTSFL